MKEDRLKEMLDYLFKLEISKDSSSMGKWKKDAIDVEARVIVEQKIREFLLDNRDDQIGILEAKVFAYEQIISKSTFAPFLNVKEKYEVSRPLTDQKIGTTCVICGMPFCVCKGESS